VSDLNQPDPDADLGEVDPVESTEERLRQDVGAPPPPPIDADEGDARRGAAVWGGGAAG
jgi:hypothetical protein